MTSLGNNPTAFDEIVGAVSPPQQRECEVKRRDGSQCRQPAVWWWAFHDCSSGFACNECVIEWHRKTTSAFATGSPQPCLWCGRPFATVADACTLVAL